MQPWGRYELSECFLFPHVNIFSLLDNNSTLVGSETHTSALCGEVPLGFYTQTVEVFSRPARRVSNGHFFFYCLVSDIWRKGFNKDSEKMSECDILNSSLTSNPSPLCLSAVHILLFILPSITAGSDLIPVTDGQNRTGCFGFSPWSSKE